MEGIRPIEAVMNPGTGVQIEYIDYRGQKTAYEARVHSMDNKALHLELSGIAFKHLSDIRVHQMKIPVTCKCSIESQDLVFFTELLKLRQASRMMLVARPAAYVLRRSFHRYDVDLPFSYYLDGIEFPDCRMVNLSFGGLSGIVKSNPKLKPGVEIVCQLKLPEFSPEYIVGKISRLEDQDRHSKLLVKFEDLTTDIENKIARYFSSISQ